MPGLSRGVCWAWLWLCPAWPVLATTVAPALHCQVRFEQGSVLSGVPLADTPALQQQGLSGRDDVGRGMWFAFAGPQILRFWMHETRQPLSIAFIDADGVLFQIEDMRPYALQVHASSRPGVAALELPAGAFTRLGVLPGQRVWRENCR